MITPPPNAFAPSPAGWTTDDRYLTLAELSQYAGFSRRQLERFIAGKLDSGQPVAPLRAYRVGKAVRVRKSDYDRWIADRQADAATVGAGLDDADRRIALALRGYDTPGGRR